MNTIFESENVRGRNYLTGLGVRWKGKDWINLEQDRHQWEAVVKMVMNLRVP
jgi:hypothetical protein